MNADVVLIQVIQKYELMQSSFYDVEFQKQIYFKTVLHPELSTRRST